MTFPNLKKRFKHAELAYTRLYYFLFMGGSGFVNPFINLFYVSLGLNGKQVGTIASTSAIVGLLAAPFVTSAIKKKPKARSYLQLLLILGALGYYLIGQQTAFLPILAIIFVQTLAASSVSPLSDALAVSVSQENDAGYGSVRVFGSLGWIVMVPASGWLIERLGFQAGFTGFSLAWLCAAALIFLIAYRYFTPPIQPEVKRPGLGQVVGKIFKNRILFGFMIAILAITFLNNGVQQFENVYLSNLGASKQLISIAGIMSALVELPFMVLSDRIMRRVGPHRLLMLALLLIMLQRLTVLVFPSIITIMIVRFLGGMPFSFYTISYIGLISAHTDPNETGTVLALFTVTLAGLVNVVASPIAGALFDSIGTRWLYAVAASGYAIAFISMWLSRPRRSHIFG
jgi:MFS transporter, PPP family, 3-phenylpropionic acid transporter